jgi:hypothetical protein
VSSGHPRCPVKAAKDALGGQPVLAGDRETGAAGEGGGRTPNLCREAAQTRSLARVPPQEPRDRAVGVRLVGDVEMAGFGPQPELGTVDRLRQEASVLRRHDGVLLAVDDQRRRSDLAEPVERVVCGGRRNLVAVRAWVRREAHAVRAWVRREAHAVRDVLGDAPACRRRVVSAYV